MTRYYLIFLSAFFSFSGYAQSVVSLGVFTGISMPFTFDQGINSDPRYTPRNDIKLCPVGINYGMDFEGYGFNISPGIVTTGQNYNIINTLGGVEGARKIKMSYINIPLGLKAHLIDLRFLKISFVASTSFAFLLDAKETVTHNESKLSFPQQVIPILPPDYTAQNDGVLAPKVANYTMLSKSDFNKHQVNIAIGFRSDWNVTDMWRVSFDLRLNYGILEPRNDRYLARLNSYATLYDIPGKRRDIFASFNVGVSRYMVFAKNKNGKKNRGKGFY